MNRTEKEIGRLESQEAELSARLKENLLAEDYTGAEKHRRSLEKVKGQLLLRRLRLEAIAEKSAQASETAKISRLRNRLRRQQELEKEQQDNNVLALGLYALWTDQAARAGRGATDQIWSQEQEDTRLQRFDKEVKRLRKLIGKPVDLEESEGLDQAWRWCTSEIGELQEYRDRVAEHVTPRLQAEAKPETPATEPEPAESLSSELAEADIEVDVLAEGY
jgi:hypothetical protein